MGEVELDDVLPIRWTIKANVAILQKCVSRRLNYLITE